MANSGINKHQVKKARDALVAKGQNPSIDAVRVELGNTGSKATIHRYLKELADENPLTPGDKPAISETLASLVEQLAAQLHQEAQDLIAEREAALQATTNALKTQSETQQQSLASISEENQRLKLQLADHEQRHKTLVTDAEARRVLVGRLEQQLADSNVLITEKEEHIDSLEEKHQHAREALEHYRQSVKEQRDQDQRRHEHQVQQLQAEIRQLNQTLSLKQSDITQLNRDNARLVAENSVSERDRAQLKLTITTLQAGAETAKEHQHKSSETIRRLQIDHEALQRTVSTLQAQLDKAHQVHRDAEMEIVSLRTELRLKNEQALSIEG